MKLSTVLARVRHVTASSRGSALVFAAFALPAGALCAAVSLTHAATPRYFPAPPPPPSPFVVAAAENDVEGACQIGAVVTEDGSNVVGAPLRLTRVTADGSAEVWQAVTDKSGAHRFLDLARGVYQLTSLIDDHAPAAAPQFRCDNNGGRAFFTLTLEKATHVFSGTVMSKNGKPAPGAELAIAQDIDGRTSLAGTARVPVAADGTFSFRVAPGKYTVLAQAPNHAPLPGKFSFDGSAKTSMAHFQLTPAPRVVGRVVDEEGHPVANALVALGGMLDPKQRAATVRSESDGTFSLPVRDGQDVVVTARGAGLVARAALGVASDPHGFSDVELVAKTGRAVEGVVSKPDGSAWAFGEVRYRIRGLGLSGTEQADADGHFVVDGMPNDADVEVWAEGNATGAWGAQVASPGNDKLALVYIPPAY